MFLSVFWEEEKMYLTCLPLLPEYELKSSVSFGFPFYVLTGICRGNRGLHIGTECSPTASHQITVRKKYPLSHLRKHCQETRMC